jgi:hypothetical protein
MWQRKAYVPSARGKERDEAIAPIKMIGTVDAIVEIAKKINLLKPLISSCSLQAASLSL